MAGDGPPMNAGDRPDGWSPVVFHWPRGPQRPAPRASGTTASGSRAAAPYSVYLQERVGGRDDKTLDAHRIRRTRNASSTAHFGIDRSRESVAEPAKSALRDGEAQIKVVRGALDVADVALERKLGRMHADHHQPFDSVPFGPRSHVRQCTLTITSGGSTERPVVLEFACAMSVN